MCSLDDQLAALSVSPDEMCEIGEYEANLSLKQNTIRIKLEKRRVTKIKKLLHLRMQRMLDNRNRKRRSRSSRKQRRIHLKRTQQEQRIIKKQINLEKSMTMVPPIKIIKGAMDRMVIIDIKTIEITGLTGNLEIVVVRFNSTMGIVTNLDHSIRISVVTNQLLTTLLSRP